MPKIYSFAYSRFHEFLYIVSRVPNTVVCLKTTDLHEHQGRDLKYRTRTPVWYHWGDTGRIAESAWHSDRKGLPGSFPKMEETVGPVSTCGRELLRGWRLSIGLMASFTIFTASVRKSLDASTYFEMSVSFLTTLHFQMFLTTVHSP
jgi:hypothetical protein